jgi:nucleoid DNA-binding protein
MDTSAKKKTITKMHLINSISAERGMSAGDVRNVIQAFLDKLTEHLSHGDRLEFRDFGVFEVVTRKPKVGRNPKKASVPIIIPARRVVKFTPGKKMKHLIDGTPYDGEE